MSQNNYHQEIERAHRAEQMEEVLRSLLAREGPPEDLKSETEHALWCEARIAVALSILLLALDHRQDGVSILPLGSVLPFRILGKTKDRGPELALPLPEGVLEKIQNEDPKRRDLLLLVEIDNDVLRRGVSPIVMPGEPS